ISFFADISQHMLEEQDSLYPYVEKLHAYLAGDIGAEQIKPLFDSNSPCEHLLRNNDDLSFFDQARYLTNHYHPPADAGIMQRSLYKELKTFETELLRHECLEFEVLLGKVISLENQSLSRLSSEK